MNVNLFCHTTHPKLSLDDLVATVNGVSYDTVSSDETLKNIIQEGHLKAFEVVQLTFECTVSYITFHYLNTYRISRFHAGDWDSSAFQVKSGRYTKFKELKVPESINNKAVAKHFKAATKLYQQLLDDGVDLGNARQVLPHLCTEVKFYWTVNVASLINFLNQRMWIGDYTASHKEIALFAEKIFSLWEIVMPKSSEFWSSYKLC